MAAGGIFMGGLAERIGVRPVVLCGAAVLGRACLAAFFIARCPDGAHTRQGVNNE